MLPSLPLNTSSFLRIRKEGRVYVDKTRWIYRLITTDTCYFISRPRRFGKSLTISTLWELFTGNKELFKGLWIYDKWDFKPHPVILFDFNSISHDNPDEFKKSLIFHMKLQAEDYGIELPEKETPKDVFDYFIKALYKKYQTGVVVLVDEYDKPILDHLGEGEERLKIAYANRDILKNFFGVLKGAGVMKELRFVFVTGVSMFTKVSMFSEWNNLTNISFDAEFADFPGYTEEEILTFFKPHLEAFSEKKGYSSIEKCMEEFRFWYNGYRFSPYRDIRIYNPVSVMTALSKGEFGNYWFETGTPSFLVKLLKNRLHTLPEFEALKVSADIFKAFDFERLPVEAVLYQAGYLTIKEVPHRKMWVLSYPNQEVRESFCDVLLMEVSDLNLKPRALADDLGFALKNEEFEGVKGILNEILAEIPYTLFARADERLFHVVFYLVLNVLGLMPRQSFLLTEDA
jgi:hypothetical protein